MARPKKQIDEKQVERLAAIGCTNKEIAGLFGCCDDTLVNRFSDVLKRGRQNLKMSLRRFQYRSAQKGSVPMQIWMGKQYLGQRDKVEVEHTADAEKWERIAAELAEKYDRPIEQVKLDLAAKKPELASILIQ